MLTVNVKKQFVKNNKKVSPSSRERVRVDIVKCLNKDYSRESREEKKHHKQSPQMDKIYSEQPTI